MSSKSPHELHSRPSAAVPPQVDRVHFLVWISAAAVACASAAVFWWIISETPGNSAALFPDETARTTSSELVEQAPTEPPRAAAPLSPPPDDSPADEADLAPQLAAALAMTDDAGRRGILRVLAADAINRSPAHAFAMLMDIAAAGDPGVFARELGFQWAQLDPAAAAAELARWPTADFRESLGAGVARALASDDPEIAADWIARLEEPGLQAAAVLGASEELIRTDLARAQHWVEALPAGEARDAGLARVAEALLRTDPQGTLQWLGDAPLGDVRLQNELVFNALARFADTDPATAGKWIAQLPAGQERAEATALYAARILEHHPAEAMQWALTLPSGELADAQAATALEHWLATDAGAARAFLQQTAAAHQRAGDSAAREQIDALLAMAVASPGLAQ